MMRRAFFLIVFALLSLGVAAQAADTFPSRPITIIVPFSAGGPSDAMARILAERMRLSLGEAVLIENVTGAGGSIGVGRAVHAAADGYTISFGHLGTHVCNGAIYKLSYDLVDDLEPVALLPSNPMIIVSRNDVPAKSLAELLAWLKSKRDARDRRHRRRRLGQPHCRALFRAGVGRKTAIRAVSRHGAGAE